MDEDPDGPLATETLRSRNVVMPDLPQHDWDLDRLGAFARHEYQTILVGERTLAAAYWRLGCALTKARKQVVRGEWLAYLHSLGIEKTRSSKACALFRTFATSEELRDQTVAEAYAARPRSRRALEVEAVEPATEPHGIVRNAMQDFEVQAAQLTSVFKTATHGELQTLLSKVRLNIDRLRNLERELTRSLDALEQI